MESLAQLVRLYDHKLDDNLTMYDKLPYNRDISLCGAGSVRMESGNLVKYYSYEIKESKNIENHDDDFLQRLREKQLQEERRKKSLEQLKEEPESKLTENELAGLLSDPSKEME